MAGDRTHGPTDEQRRERHESRAGTTFKEFLRDLQGASGLSEDMSKRAAVSVLCAIDRRISAEESEDLRAQLPSKLQELVQPCQVHKGEKPERFGADEFVSRVASDLGKSDPETLVIVRSVVEVLRMHITPGEADDVESQLPTDLAALWRLES